MSPEEQGQCLVTIVFLCPVSLAIGRPSVNTYIMSEFGRQACNYPEALEGGEALELPN